MIPSLAGAHSTCTHTRTRTHTGSSTKISTSSRPLLPTHAPRRTVPPPPPPPTPSRSSIVRTGRVRGSTAGRGALHYKIKAFAATRRYTAQHGRRSLAQRRIPPNTSEGVVDLPVGCPHYSHTIRQKNPGYASVFSPTARHLAVCLILYTDPIERELGRRVDAQKA